MIAATLLAAIAGLVGPLLADESAAADRLGLKLFDHHNQGGGVHRSWPTR